MYRYRWYCHMCHYSNSFHMSWCNFLRNSHACKLKAETCLCNDKNRKNFNSWYEKNTDKKRFTKEKKLTYILFYFQFCKLLAFNILLIDVFWNQIHMRSIKILHHHSLHCDNFLKQLLILKQTVMKHIGLMFFELQIFCDLFCDNTIP